MAGHRIKKIDSNEWSYRGGFIVHNTRGGGPMLRGNWYWNFHGCYGWRRTRNEAKKAIDGVLAYAASILDAERVERNGTWKAVQP